MRRFLPWILSLWVCGGVAGARAAPDADPGPSSSPSSSTAPVPATRVEPTDWHSTVRALADALVHSGDSDAFVRALPVNTPIRRFDRTEPQDRLSLRDATAGAVVISARAYESRPTTAASDLAGDVREASFLPEPLRMEFGLDPADTKFVERANETAGQWLMGALQPSIDQPIGMIVLWQERAPATPSQQPQSRMIFILVKGQRVAADEFRITFVLYGDTSQIVG